MPGGRCWIVSSSVVNPSAAGWFDTGETKTFFDHVISEQHGDFTVRIFDLNSEERLIERDALRQSGGFRRPRHWRGSGSVGRRGHLAQRPWLASECQLAQIIPLKGLNSAPAAADLPPIRFGFRIELDPSRHGTL